jgi:outer membrane protein assembly factor BamE (lipoprotein component of BamABCDE complex)
MIKKILTLFVIASVILLFGCTTAREHKQNLGTDKENEMTLGQVQKEIHKGMSGAEVAEALGSPNQVTKDENDDETWIYDKIATEVTYDQSTGGWFLILGGESYRSGAVQTKQKTLTVVIKFDVNKKVKAFSYHSSQY